MAAGRPPGHTYYALCAVLLQFAILLATLLSEQGYLVLMSVACCSVAAEVLAYQICADNAFSPLESDFANLSVCAVAALSAAPVFDSI